MKAFTTLLIDTSMEYLSSRPFGLESFRNGNVDFLGNADATLTAELKSQYDSKLASDPAKSFVQSVRQPTRN
jgi:hypothetical protein